MTSSIELYHTNLSLETEGTALSAGRAVCQPPEVAKCPIRVSFCEGESGRRDSNPRRPAWKAYRSIRCSTLNG